MKKLIKRFRKLPTPLLIMLVNGKAIISLGIGVLLATYLINWVWGIIILGVILMIPGGNKVLTGK
ncbi:hypothetical protein ISS04_02145 [Candidatus Woesearchaeota archaeon]|nr:hypothetical protein [Candidatus Woesearchaeota archaeon]